jgi:hypothetical protein
VVDTEAGERSGAVFAAARGAVRAASRDRIIVLTSTAAAACNGPASGIFARGTVRTASATALKTSAAKAAQAAHRMHASTFSRRDGAIDEVSVVAIWVPLGTWRGSGQPMKRVRP